MKRIGPFVALLLVSVGIYLRLVDLHEPPLQFDESVNWHLASLYQGSGALPYNAEHFHGPLFFRLLALTNLDSEHATRLPSAIAGVILLFVCCLTAKRHGGWRAANTVAALLALDPLMVFFNRVAIHESLFALLTVSYVLTLWSFAETRTWSLGLVAGVFLGLLAATKETCVISFVASLVALALTVKPPVNVLAGGALTVAVGAVVGVSLGFSSLSGVADVPRGIWAWAEKGLSDATQFQPWWFYLRQLATSSPLAILGLVALMGRNSFSRYLAAQGFLCLLAYSLLPYKTPWLLVSVVPLLLMALGIETRRPAQALLTSTTAAVMYLTPASTAYLRLNDSSPDVRMLAHDVEATCARVGESCAVFIGARWYWPLPFYLRHLHAQVTYADGPKALPVDTFDVIVLPSQARGLEGWMRREYTLSRVQSVSAFWRSEADSL